MKAILCRDTSVQLDKSQSKSKDFN